MKRLIFLMVAVAVLCSCDKDFETWKNLNTKWLEENAPTDTVKLEKTASGLQYQVFHQSYGAVPKLSSLVCVTYKGWMIDGTVFDSGKSVWMSVGNTVLGWKEALGKMNQGSHWKIYVPYTLGYGSEGTKTMFGNYKIPPYTTLIFDIELVDVINY